MLTRKVASVKAHVLDHPQTPMLRCSHTKASMMPIQSHSNPWCRKRVSNASILFQSANRTKRITSKSRGQAQVRLRSAQPSQLALAHCEARAAATPHSFYTTFDIMSASLAAVLPLQKLRVCTCCLSCYNDDPQKKKKGLVLEIQGLVID